MKIATSDTGYTWNVLEPQDVKGYINHRIYTDVESWAILEISANGKRGKAVRVEIPSEKCYDRKAAVRNGTPDTPCTLGKPFDIKFTYGKWRSADGEFVLGTQISEHCGYYYDLNF